MISWRQPGDSEQCCHLAEDVTPFLFGFSLSTQFPPIVQKYVCLGQLENKETSAEGVIMGQLHRLEVERRLMMWLPH